MNGRVLLGWAVVALVAGCPRQQEVKQRAQLRDVSGSTVQVIPAEGQLPYCLVFTISENKVVRQLTMNRDNKSVKCEAGQPIGRVSFRIPREEGKVKVLVFFSDQKLNAGSVAEQIYELTAEGKKFFAYDLRLPGNVNTETIDFEPAEDVPTVSGEAVGQGGALASDAGAPPPPPAPPPADAGDGGK